MDELTVGGAVEYVQAEFGLKVSPGTVRRWVAAGAVVGRKDARGTLRIDPVSIDAFLFVGTETIGSESQDG